MKEYPHVEKRRIEALIRSLEAVIRRDPEQEVQSLAIPVLRTPDMGRWILEGHWWGLTW
jgi:hypothetical protein